MSEPGCMFCRDAGPDFDWCRICGRGLPDEPEPPKPETALAEAVRKAQGRYTGAEVERMILATHPPGCSCGKHEEA